MFKNTSDYSLELRYKALMLNVIKIAVIISIFFIVIGAIIGALYFFDEDGEGRFLGGLIWVAFGILALIMPPLMISASKKGVKKVYDGPSVQDKHTVFHFAFDDNYLYARSVRQDIELGRDTIPYELLKKVVIHDDYIQAFIFDANLYLIPKSGMTEGTYEELVSHLAHRIPQNVFFNKIKAKK